MPLFASALSIPIPKAFVATITTLTILPTVLFQILLFMRGRHENNRQRYLPSESMSYLFVCLRLERRQCCCGTVCRMCSSQPYCRPCVRHMTSSHVRSWCETDSYPGKQPLLNVIYNLCRGSGGQRQCRHPLEKMPDIGNFEVGGAEIISPLEMQCDSSTASRQTSMACSLVMKISEESFRRRKET